MKLTVTEVKCRYCGHKWVVRTTKEPRQCPSCWKTRPLKLAKNGKEHK